MPERTQKQIEAEIEALQGCKAYIPHFTKFGDDNHARLDLQIAYLRGDIDITSDEWDDHSEEQQTLLLETESWEEGYTDEAPSSQWDSYKPLAKNRDKKN